MLSADRRGASSFGIGAITDGVWKLSIQVSNFQSIDIEKGAAVSVNGKVRTDSGNFLFTIQFQ